MPFTYSISRERSLVTVRMTGRMDMNDALSAIETFTADRQFHVRDSIYFDVRQTDYLPRYGEVSTFYHVYRDTYRQKILGRVAIVVSSKLQYGIARMSSTIFAAINLNMEVFLSPEEALAWLKGTEDWISAGSSGADQSVIGTPTGSDKDG